MARYELRSVGVFDKETQKEVKPGMAEWDEYQKWLDKHNVPDREPGKSYKRRPRVV